MKVPKGLAICTYDVGDLVLRCWWSTHVGGIERFGLSNVLDNKMAGGKFSQVGNG